MAVVIPFRAVRPADRYAAEVAALPYDVYSREEAAEAVKGKPLSFLNIDRPETMFPADRDMYAEEVYEAARQRYQSQKAEGIYVEDEAKCYYIYEETMNGRSQTGIAALSSVDDYLNGVCRKHENTVQKKETDRINHVDYMSAQTGPIFLSYHRREAIDAAVDAWKQGHAPVNDFVSEDGIRHRVWVIDDVSTISVIRDEFAALEHTYIADGHHRAASAVKVALKRREAAGASFTEDAEYNYFLSVLFPDDQLEIMDYNRIVTDLNGMDTSDFLDALEEVFDVELTALACNAGESGTDSSGEASGIDSRRSAGGIAPTLRASAEEVLRPSGKYDIGMYLNGRSYMLHLKADRRTGIEGDPVRSLDVSVLQEEVLSKLLGIEDPRTDPRISFVGGIRGLGELVRRVDAMPVSDRGPAVAFAMHPTSIAELFSVADAGRLMPPKSTWFEPKLRSGLFIHEF